jgi:hypothetical protein
MRRRQGRTGVGRSQVRYPVFRMLATLTSKAADCARFILKQPLCHRSLGNANAIWHMQAA